MSAAGCHDNRMDKIWWNEQWMGWPIGPEYAESSNVDNAYRLQGKVLLIVGEMDNNVDPASTFQVVNQLIKHNKDFDLLVIPGAVTRNGGAYGDHKRFDFFSRHLLGQSRRTGRHSRPRRGKPPRPRPCRSARYLGRRSRGGCCAAAASARATPAATANDRMMGLSL